MNNLTRFGVFAFLVALLCGCASSAIDRALQDPSSEKSQDAYRNSLSTLLAIPRSKVNDLPYLKSHFTSLIGVNSLRNQAHSKIIQAFSGPAHGLKVSLDLKDDQVVVSYEDNVMILEGFFHFQFDKEFQYIGMDYIVVSKRR